MVSPAPVSQITYLQSHVFIKLLSSLIRALFLDLLLHCLWIKHLFIQIKTHLVFEWVGISVGRFGSLTFLELLPVKYEFLNILLFLLNFLDVILISMRYLDACLLEVQLCLN